MYRALPLIVLVSACGVLGETPAPEENPLELEVEMAETTLMIPASEAEMLREEIVALRAETERLRTELAESDEVEPTQVARHASAVSRLNKATSELERLRAELEATKSELAESEERNQILTATLVETSKELDRTEAELEQTVVVLRRTRDDLSGALRVAADAGWSDLVARSQVALCPKGGKNKMANCRAEAQAAIAPLEEVSRACIGSGQAVPELRGREKGENMPSHSVFLGSTDLDWYVQLCDPSLPEARALLANQSNKAPARAPTTKVADKRVASRSSSSGSTKRTSYSAPKKAAKPRETAEPTDLLAEASTSRRSDLDADEASSTAKESREERKRRKEREEQADARRNLNLNGIGDDLDDLDDL